ncbi:MAG: hypothetical protein V4507_15385 [Verrucomicrobiota bacterium]
MSVKEMVLSALHRLPDDVEFKDIAEEIAFLSAVREGQDDLSQSRIVSNEEMKKRIDSWTGA